MMLFASLPENTWPFSILLQGVSIMILQTTLNMHPAGDPGGGGGGGGGLRMLRHDNTTAEKMQGLL